MRTSAKTKRTVLAVDDDEVNLSILIKIAGDAGYNVKPFATPEAAWSHLENNHDIDIAILDKMMANISGLDMMARMKNHAHLRHIPVIIQTGDVGTAQMREGLEQGAYYYLTKPFLPGIMTAVLASAEHECNLRAEMISQVVAGQGRFLGLVQNAVFNFHSHAEARLLAVHIAQLSAVPDLVMRGLMELFYNAVEHGCLEIGYQNKHDCMLSKTFTQEVANRMAWPQYKYRAAIVQLQIVQSAVHITVTDPGKGFRWRQYLDSNAGLKLNQVSGRGIVIASRALERLQYNAQGNEVQASFVLKGHKGNTPVQRMA